jgi:hypothetical protein
MAQELPSPLQERFGSRMMKLSTDDQTAIRIALGSVARMMDLEELETLGKKPEQSKTTPHTTRKK